MGRHKGASSAASEDDHSNNEMSQVTLHPTGPPVAPPPPREIKVGPTLVLGLTLFVAVLLAVSVGAPWLRVDQYAVGPNGEDVMEMFGLWRSVRKEGDVTITTTTSDIECAARQRRVRALEALSILSLVVALITVVVAIANYRADNKKPRVRLAAICCVAAIFICITAECAVGINVYTWTFAGCSTEASYHSRLFEPYVGFAFTLTAWALSSLAGILVYNNPVVQADARSIDGGATVFTAFSFIALLFVVVACPIPQWFYKDGINMTVTDVFLWKERYGILWNTTAPTTSTAVWDLGCDSVARYFHATEALSIISIFLGACAVVTGFLLCKGLAGATNVALAFGYMTVIATLVEWTLALRIYYGSWCGNAIAYQTKKYVLSAGFALSVAGFVIMALGTGVLTVAEVIRRRYFPSTAPKKTFTEIVVEMSM
ncbi:hypothetical protein DQ04_02441070 [Trypanosoma grayi]|uniref:hypothetical protein n=1 Tax=Trypanosoma grayi TaxID=71804 RepID=UPI0004F4885E|nr:hypothetical protein DQ04_02441070 [Trypanosoma grayi]KEG11618.1 hypothetical protein DQ04_02441070 [Trypanosoma grayi]